MWEIWGFGQGSKHKTYAEAVAAASEDAKKLLTNTGIYVGKHGCIRAVVVHDNVNGVRVLRSTFGPVKD